MGAQLILTVLGCSGSYPGPGEACSGYLLEAGWTTIWLDAGPGSLANLQQHVDLRSVDAVVLTHAHPDHWTDVLGFYVACKWYLDRAGVAVYSPADVRRLAGEFHDPIAPTFDWHVVEDGSCVEVGPVVLTFSRTDHPGETLAVRVDADDQSLGYTADTGPGWSLARLGSGWDLALCEATLPADQEGAMAHLTARQAGEMAAAAGARRLVLTHLQPGLDPGESRAAAAASFDGPVEVAATGDRYEL